MSTRLAFLTLSAMLVVLATIVWVHRSANRDGTDQNQINSIAILPLENLSGDDAQDYLAYGVTSELITSLGQIGGLRVISLTTAMQYKHPRKPVSQIAQELKADAILDGSVLRSGDKLWISTQLVDARADRQIWAQSYEGEVHEILGLQNQVAGAVAEQIRVKLTAKARPTDTRSFNPQAYEAFLKGQFYFEANSPEASQTSLRYFQRAGRTRSEFRSRLGRPGAHL
jgi:TolB-like protein